MRRALALAALITVTAVGTASAEHWTKYVDVPGGLAWSYDADYTYKDKQTGRIVVMQAISKPDANKGPAKPGDPNGVGSVVALDCAKKNLIALGGYKPSAPLQIKEGWRSDTPKRAEGAENEALVAAVCANADKAPVK
ncbi:MAG: hypothetical protein ACJ798_19890 [Phenylobacterium sp.]